MNHETTESLFIKLIKRAQFEFELELGVNLNNHVQSNVSFLSERDFGYIKSKCFGRKTFVRRKMACQNITYYP